jgi:hypothetical protein
LKQTDSTNAQSRTKDEDMRKLAEILRREEYQKPEPKTGESIFQRWLRSFLEWLEGVFPKANPSAPDTSVMDVLAVILKVLLFGILAGLAAFLIYKLATLINPKYRRAPRTKKKSRVILGEQIGEDQSASDLFGEAERLAREGNLRSAIRKGYIALLGELSDRKLIGLAQHKTNRDYLREVRSRNALHPPMKAATETFEQHWYGSQNSSESDWARFRDEYDKAVRSA